jgi:hypothetical protein
MFLSRILTELLNFLYDLYISNVFILTFFHAPIDLPLIPSPFSTSALTVAIIRHSVAQRNEFESAV